MTDVQVMPWVSQRIQSNGFIPDTEVAVNDCNFLERQYDRNMRESQNEWLLSLGYDPGNLVGKM